MRIPNQDGQPVKNERSYEDQVALRMIWLAFAGWWLSIAWVVAAWLCVIVPPFTRKGLWMFANVSRVVSLRSPGDDCQDLLDDTLFNLTAPGRQQPLLTRIIYCLALGWWISLVWTLVAWADSVSIDRRPTGVARFMRLPRLANLWMYSPAVRPKP